MADLASLANIPFYGAYVARKQMNEDQPFQDIRQASALLGLRRAVQGYQQEQQLQSLLANSGGDLEAAMNAATRSGNLAAAAKLAPIVEARRKAAQGRIVPAGGAIVGEDNKPVFTNPPRPAQDPEVLRIMAARDALPVGHPNRAILDKAIEKLTTPNAGVNVYSTSLVPGVDDNGNPVFVQPSGQPGVAPRVVSGVRPAPKAGEGLTPENAGKVAMAEQSINGIDTVKALLFDNAGNINRWLVAAMNVPLASGMPFNDNARIAKAALRNAVEAKLRLETGAAATQSEIDRIMDRYSPTISDTPKSAKYKLDQLQEFFKSSLAQTKGVKAQGSSSEPSIDDLLKKYGQ